MQEITARPHTQEQSAFTCSCGCCCGHDSHAGHDHETHEHAHDHEHNHEEAPWGRLAVAGAFALVAELLELAEEWHFLGLQPQEWQLLGQPVAPWLIVAASLLAMAIGGLSVIIEGWKSLLAGKLNMLALMGLAVTGAFLIGQYPEAAMVIVLFNVSETIESLSLDKARHAIKNLLALAPEHATVQQADGTWRGVDVHDVALESIVRVKPGEKIALDGIVTAGHSAVNQAPITGESLPVEKEPGDSLWAGTINTQGELEFRVTARAADTTLARIINAVENAQSSQAPIQRFVDSFARYYTPAVFALALVTAGVCALALGQAWTDAIYRGLVVLVIGCPCALVISIPVTIVAGLACATRSGILVKGGLYLEQGRKLTCLALDKTGTLTHGTPVLTDTIPLGTADLDAERVAAALASRSDHPVSLAIACGLAGKVNDVELPDVRDFIALPGRGVTGTINGISWAMGNYALVRERGFHREQLEQQVRELEAQGKSVVALVHPETGVVAILAVADTLRPESATAVAALAQRGVAPVLLTGDNAAATAHMAKQAGVARWHSDLMPEDKLRLVDELAAQGEVVGMVGDGINDAPALAKARIGFAIARQGTDTALETADVALMDDDLRKIPRFIDLSQATHAIVLENIVFALGMKSIFFALAFMGMATMWMAVFADVGTTVLVVLNGMRALHK